MSSCAVTLHIATFHDTSGPRPAACLLQRLSPVGPRVAHALLGCAASPGTRSCSVLGAVHTEGSWGGPFTHRFTVSSFL